MSDDTDLIARLRGRAWFNRGDLDIAREAAAKRKGQPT